MKKILIINAGPTFDEISEVNGQFHKMVSDRLGTDQFFVVDVHKGEKLPDPSEIAGAIMTGSHDMVTDRLEWSETTAAWIKKAVEGGLPFLGICYGHQLLADAMGGEAGYHKDGMEIGTVEVSLMPEAVCDELLCDLPAEFKAHAVHSQTALKLPEGAVRLAYNSHDPHHAFRIKNAWGVQFHPEFSAGIIEGYIRKSDKCDESLLAEVKNTPEAESVLRRFARICLKG